MDAPKPEDIIGTIMTRDPITIRSDAPIRKALQTLIRKDIGSLIVVKNGEPVGIITERDVTRRSLRAAKGKRFYERSVSRIMSHPLITVPPSTPVWQAFETMVTKRIRRLPVVQDSRLVGIVTERDLFKWVLSVFYEPNIPENVRKFLE
jgi:CBS domain-containing protein